MWSSVATRFVQDSGRRSSSSLTESSFETQEAWGWRFSASSEISMGVPGGPPLAEVALVRRLAELQPDARFHAVFDLDPAGIRIARLLEERSGVTLAPTGMTPELFARARKRLPLNRWDEAQLKRYAGDAAALEPLRAAIAAAGGKVEQETIQRRLYALLDADA